VDTLESRDDLLTEPIAVTVNEDEPAHDPTDASPTTRVAVAMDRRQPRAARAQRHHLLGDDSRLAIVEALEEGPRQIPELVKMIGIHRTTVQGHLDKLMAAGLVDAEAGVLGGRGRPSKRYRLKVPLLGGEPEMRLFVDSLISLIRKAYSNDAIAASEEEGRDRGRGLTRPLRHPSLEQTAREVADTLEHLSFSPKPTARRKDGLAIDLEHCPFRVDPDDPDGPIVCAFHEGLVQGIAEVASGDDVAVRVVPFSAPGLCRVELDAKAAPVTRTAKRQAAPRRTAGGERQSPS
jgi:predicted ArsR family transcriptional regulator